MDLTDALKNASNVSTTRSVSYGNYTTAELKAALRALHINMVSKEHQRKELAKKGEFVESMLAGWF